MPHEEETQSRIIKTNTNTKSVKSSKESYQDAENEFEAEQIKKDKNKSYTQRKANKFMSVKYNFGTHDRDSRDHHGDYLNKN